MKATKGSMALLSLKSFVHLLTSRSIHLPRDRIGQSYRITDGGTYTIFRDTEREIESKDSGVVLLVHFRLRTIGSNSILHWIFRRVCIVSMPIWIGLDGFKVKLWMIDNVSKDYLGIYEWKGEQNARVYVNWLYGLLRPLSVKGSIWHKIITNESLESFLEPRRVKGPTLVNVAYASSMILPSSGMLTRSLFPVLKFEDRILVLN